MYNFAQEKHLSLFSLKRGEKFKLNYMKRKENKLENHYKDTYEYQFLNKI